MERKNKHFVADLKWVRYKFKYILIIYNIIFFRLETIHKANFVHRDFHSGNILFDSSNNNKYQWNVGDFGLSQPANSSNNEIYGVIPYVAPEVFKRYKFS